MLMRKFLGLADRAVRQSRGTTFDIGGDGSRKALDKKKKVTGLRSEYEDNLQWKRF